MSDLTTNYDTYDYVDGDRMEPVGVCLDVAQRIASQLSNLLSNEEIKNAHVREDGLMLNISYESWGNNKTFHYEALLTWDVLLNGDISLWSCNVENAAKAKRSEKITQDRAREQEVAARLVEKRAAAQRQADLATYERIKEELSTGQAGE